MTTYHSKMEKSSKGGVNAPKKQSEDQLQSSIVRKFSELHPEKRGQLFHVANERNHALQAMQARSKGIFPGVADLIYIDLKSMFQPRILGIELKTPGSSHKVDTVRQQVEWGEILEKNGGTWRLCDNIDDAMYCINGFYEGFTTQEVREKLANNGNKKTIKF